MARALRFASLATVLLALPGCAGGGGRVKSPDEQLGFGVRMAERGLWSEALFRFEQAQRLGGGSDAQVLNNLAVAHEALGNFDQALELYRQALALDPGNRDLKANYDRFVSFYESFRAQASGGETAAAGEQAGAAPAVPAVDSGTAGPPSGPGGPEAPLIPGADEPEPIPDPAPDPDGPSDPPASLGGSPRRGD
jgi:tetratricopeptide (TPR) repeat protein